MAPTDARDAFFQNIRQALGRSEGAPPDVPIAESAFSEDPRSVETRARSIRLEAETRSAELMSRLEDSASQAGWKVARVKSAEEASHYVRALAKDMEARSVVRSAHPVVDRLNLETSLDPFGIQVSRMAVGDQTDEHKLEERRRLFRHKAIEADIGVTGADYAIAETGTCVLFAREGVSRLVSLLPPVHVALVEKGQVLPSLDELFTLHRRDFLEGNLGSYMNLISGPSRSADIEYTLVTGVHGPGEVHLVLIG